MKNLGEILCDLQDITFFWRARSRAWKNLAKQYKQTFEHFSARPGQMLALMMLEADTKDTPLGNMAAECMAWALQALLIKNPQAKNYVEVTLDAPDGSKFYVTIQRPEGKTPNQLKDEALIERDIALIDKADLEKRIILLENDAAQANKVIQQDLVEYTELKVKCDKAVGELETLKKNLGA